MAFIIVSALTPKKEYVKLDYGRPVVTDAYALICPKSVLFDVRASHDANAIFEAFTSLSGREDKAHALGCEVVQGGLPVHARRMESPFSEYVSVDLLGGPSAEYFTMEGNLRNSADEVAPIYPAKAAPGTSKLAPSVDAQATSVQEATTLPSDPSENGRQEVPPTVLSAEAGAAWRVIPNGDEVLSDGAGQCASIKASPTASANELTLTLIDGTEHLYTADKHAAAIQHAQEFCSKRGK